jgi:hypothetical protein
MNSLANKKSGNSKPKIRFSLIDFLDRIIYFGFNAKTMFTFANDAHQYLIFILNSSTRLSAFNFFSQKKPNSSRGEDGKPRVSSRQPGCLKRRPAFFIG